MSSLVPNRYETHGGDTLTKDTEQRQVTLLYGDERVSFGWQTDLAPKAFAEQLRDAVRYVTGRSSLQGMELQSCIAEPAFAQVPRLTPRDIFEGRADRARIVVPEILADLGKMQEASENPSKLNSTQQVRASFAPESKLDGDVSKSTSTQQSPKSVRAGSAPEAKLDRVAPSEVKPSGRFQKKGGSQMEFMRIMNANKNPVAPLPPDVRLTIEEVAKHRKMGNCWTIYQGRVYDITLYVEFHPGGKGEIMKGAGKDCTELYDKIHPWVNAEGLLGRLCLGKLVPSVA